MAHYIAMSGLHGYLPQFCCAVDSRKEAVDTLADLHELSTRQVKELRRTGSVELKQEQGAEYCEWSLCSCWTPEVHNDV